MLRYVLAALLLLVTAQASRAALSGRPLDVTKRTLLAAPGADPRRFVRIHRWHRVAIERL